MGSIAELETFENESARFDSLMRLKIQNILSVSSLYDIYNLREDGQLANMIMSEYAELQLSRAPAIKRVDSGASALETLRENRFDIVIVFRSMTDVDAAEFVRQAKELHPGIPVVLLAFHHRELELARDGGDRTYNAVFYWSGEARILLTIIKIFWPPTCF